MDEYNSGMDPEVKRYFRKIINSLSLLSFWMLIMATTGFGLRLALFSVKPHWYNYLFYSIAMISLTGVVIFLKRIWKKPV